jgi:hypothetical protein
VIRYRWGCERSRRDNCCRRMERIRTALDLRLWLIRLFVSGCKPARVAARTIWLLPLLVGRNRWGDIEMPTIPRPLTVLLIDDERNTRDI